MAEKTTDRVSTRTIDEVVEQIGFGLTHLRYGLTGGGAYVGDGAEIMLISAITNTLAREWGLLPMQRGLLVTTVYIGILAGSVISGPIGDKYGRRTCILLSYVITWFASMASSYAQSFLMLAAIRFLVGTGFGIGVPSFAALAVEITTKNERIITQCCGQALYTVGEIYATILIILDDPSMNDLHWRSLVRLSAIPAALFLCASMLWLDESPSYLATCGRYEEAKNVLRRNAIDNWKPDLDVDFKLPATPTTENVTLGAQIPVLFDWHFLPVTLACSYTAVTINAVHFGCAYAFPQLLQQRSSSGSAGLQLMIGTTWEFPGILLAILFSMYFPRRIVLKMGMFFNCLSVVFFAIGTTTNWGALSEVLFLLGYYGTKAFTMFSFSATNVFVSEVYPVSIRNTGAAFAIAVGRLGAIVSPLWFEQLCILTGSHAAFFYILGILALLNIVIVDFAQSDPSTQIMSDFVHESVNFVPDLKESPSSSQQSDSPPSTR